MQTLNLMYILDDDSDYYLLDRRNIPISMKAFVACYADLNCRIVDENKTESVAAIYNLRWKE